MPRGVLTGSAASKGTAYRSADLIWLATRFQNSSQTWEPLDAAVPVPSQACSAVQAADTSTVSPAEDTGPGQTWANASSLKRAL